MADTNGVTKVRFDLWTVLGFLALIFAICFGYLFNAQAVSKDERIKSDQALCDRVTKLETQYIHIIDGIEKLTKTVEKTGDKLDTYRLEVKNKKTKISDIQLK